MIRSISFVIFLFFLFSFSTVTAQKYVSIKGQVAMKVDSEECPFEVSNTSLGVTLNKQSEECSIEFSSFFFQIKDKRRKKHFLTKCFPVKEYPVIHFKGNMEGIERIDLKGKGQYSLRLVGEWHINGAVIAAAETVQVEVEHEQVRLSFHTSLKQGDKAIELDIETLLLRRAVRRGD